MKDWFNFEGRINGWQYLGRGFASILFFIPGVILSSFSLEFGISLIALGYIPAIWLMLSTVNKRLNAFAATSNQKIIGWLMYIFVPVVPLLLWVFDGFIKAKK